MTCIVVRKNSYWCHSMPFILILQKEICILTTQCLLLIDYLIEYLDLFADETVVQFYGCKSNYIIF